MTDRRKMTMSLIWKDNCICCTYIYIIYTIHTVQQYQYYTVIYIYVILNKKVATNRKILNVNTYVILTNGEYYVHRTFRIFFTFRQLLFVVQINDIIRTCKHRWKKIYIYLSSRWKVEYVVSSKKS